MPASKGLISTVAYQLAGGSPRYALQGSVANAGTLIQWIQDSSGLIERSADIEALARRTPDSGGVVIVPAFSGLLAPYWRSDARAVLVGLSRSTDKRHIARAALEAIAFQTLDLIDALNEDTGVPLRELRVDGGMVVNDLLMQMQADLLGVPVVRPRVIETTSLGAAYVAGLSTGFWRSTDELANNWREERRWVSGISGSERTRRVARWRSAVARSVGWLDEPIAGS